MSSHTLRLILPGSSSHTVTESTTATVTNLFEPRKSEELSFTPGVDPSPQTASISGGGSVALYQAAGVPGYELSLGPDTKASYFNSWVFGTELVNHDLILLIRATKTGTDANATFSVSGSSSYRTMPIADAGTLPTMSLVQFHALPLAHHYQGLHETLSEEMFMVPFLFISNVVIAPESTTITTSKSGRIEVGKEFEANQVALTHTAIYASSQAALLDELRLRGLAVTFGHLLHGHGHSHSGSGNERSRQPHFHVHIDHGKTSTMVSRHNIHYKAMHIPHLIDFQYVYEDDGKPLSDEHARAIGQVVLTLTFEGFTV